MTRRIVLALALLLGTGACATEVTGSPGGGGADPGTSASTGSASPVTTSTGQGSGGGVAGGACSSDVDCADGDLCAYPIADACASTAACVKRPVPEPCNSIFIEHACGCDGTDLSWTMGCDPSLPDGYAPAPVAHMGACDHPRVGCTSSDECVPANGYTPPSGFTRGECAYPASDGCSAAGVCLDPFPECDNDTDVVACACDGTRIDMYCGYPASTYAPKPLDHYGPCDLPPSP